MGCKIGVMSLNPGLEYYFYIIIFSLPLTQVEQLSLTDESTVMSPSRKRSFLNLSNEV